MFKVIVLLCATGIPGSECTFRTAHAVFHGPDASSSQDCIRNAYFAISQAAQPIDFSSEYPKVICARPQDVQQSTSRDESPLAH